MHRNTIHNSQEVEATRVSISGWTDEQKVIQTYGGILFGLKKGENSVTCYNMNEPSGHYVKWSKPSTER